MQIVRETDESPAPIELGLFMRSGSYVTLTGRKEVERACERAGWKTAESCRKNMFWNVLKHKLVCFLQLSRPVGRVLSC